MRKILFRGKHIDDSEWVYGSFIHQTDFYGDPADKHFILDGTKTMDYDIGYTNEVIPETVGQFTGLTDKNGTKIFEGDNIRYKTTFLTAIVFYEDGAFQVVFGGMHQHDLKDLDLRYVEVIGNIHERENK